MCKRRGRRRMLTFTALFAALLLWWLGDHRPEQPSIKPKAPARPEMNPVGATQSAEPRETDTDPVRGTLNRLQAPHDVAGARKALEQLRHHLGTMPPQAATASVLKFLETKQDAPTGLGFVVGDGGGLVEAPTLRVFLLDWLTQTHPDAATSYAETVLATMESADEWAVALRHLALIGVTPEARDVLRGKMLAMLQYEPWQREASAGYLEAFDVAVYLGGTNLLPPLAELLRQQESQALAHAAYLALDRLVIAEPTKALRALRGAPEWMQGREATRANYFARADVRDSAQRSLVEEYLLSPETGAPERRKFAELYPNANLMISPNLLTQVDTPSQAELAARDRHALGVVDQWLRDPRFADRRRELELMRRRLAAFVEGAPKPQN